MENSAADPKSTLNTTAFMGCTSLETLQRSFGNLHVKNGLAIAPQAQGKRVSSSLPLNGSLTGVLPGLLSNRESILDSSKILNVGHGFGAPYPYSLASPERKDSMFNNVNLIGSFSNGNPGLPSHPEASSNVFWTQQRINGNVRPRVSRIITLAMTEDGSKYLQDLLLKDSSIRKLIFEGVIEYIFQLMTNQYGRYLFQKLIELEDQNQLGMIMEKLASSCGAIFDASIDKYGSYSMKKLIKVLEKSPLVTEVVKALCNKFWELMVNQTGQNVIMECLDTVDSQKNDFLYIEAINNCLQLATHERGCASLNSFISRIKGPRRDELLNLISDHVVYLAQDPAGNFVVQCVLELHNPAIIDKICSNLKGYYVKLSIQKGGSHVVEKCLRSAGMDHVVIEFLQSNQLFQVAKDQYGNYVLQTALRETKKTCSPLHESLVVKLQQHLNRLQHGYGRNILTLMTATVQQSMI
ncbi:putative pumilio homolog 8, chloroplastic [Durio zibethinus]|uniref:Pumilio homolog 8, chloroplastic n=1 Tax=Durio zibethinus TaxID=66656 RepID=A0A6P5Y1Q8_DURZI|nr:putative pumilio homolog 8, chloroplastic [Durio zibethinus]